MPGDGELPPQKWERVNVPHGGCEGVGRAACLERSRQGPHAWESHVATTRAAPELLRGGSWHWQQHGRSPEQIRQSRGIAGRGWSSSVARSPPPQAPPHRLPRTPSSKKHRSKRSLAASADRACLLEQGASHSVPGSAVPRLGGEIQSEGMGIWSCFAGPLFGLVSAQPI